MTAFFPPEVGGLQTYSYRVAKAFCENDPKTRVTVVTTHVGEHSDETDRNIRIIKLAKSKLPTSFLRNIHNKIRSIRFLFSITHEKFDFTHSTTWHIPAIFRNWYRKTPIAVSVHGAEVFDISHDKLDRMRSVFRQAAVTVSVSKPIRLKFEALLGFEPTCSAVAWNGVSFSAADQKADLAMDPTKILSVCRLISRKNVERAIRALAILRDENIPFQFNIAGSGPLRDDLQQLITELNLTERVALLGWVDDNQLLHEYRTSGVFLHPQIALADGGDIEGFGISIADAMFFGACPIAGKSGGPSDFIEDGVTGRLVDGESVAEIADALRDVLTDHPLQRRLGSAAKDFAETQLSWGAHAAKIVELVRRSTETSDS
ncbi:MAG: glycosyltransferase family 4 protein [Pseudomonadota bacterium]